MSEVLVTGAAGAVGQPVCAELLRRGFTVRAFDRTPSPLGTTILTGDLVDPEAVRRAAAGVQCIVHLAAEPRDQAFPELVAPNVIGLFHVMDAARLEGAARVILASSIQVLSRRPKDAGPASVTERSPGNHYALTKVWAEEMGAMYARRYGLSVLAVRIAWMVRNLDEALSMQAKGFFDLYLSRNDVGRFFAQAVSAPDISFAVLYAASRGAERRFDMEPARRLIGYEPVDTWPEGLGFALPEASPA